MGTLESGNTVDQEIILEPEITLAPENTEEPENFSWLCSEPCGSCGETAPCFAKPRSRDRLRKRNKPREWEKQQNDSVNTGKRRNRQCCPQTY